MVSRAVVTLFFCGAAACPAIVAENVSTTPLFYVPLTTVCRAVDTRLVGGAIAGGTSQSFNPAGGACSIPSQGSNPIAYATNVTVIPHGPLGFATVWPTGQAQPLVSTLNSPDGRVKANAAIVAGGSGGQISVYASDTTDVVVDVSGYFTTDTTADVYVPITPCRLVDTRVNTGTQFGAPSLVAGQLRTFTVTNSGCNLPATALANGGAVSLNVTSVPIASHLVSYLTVWGSSAYVPQPLASTLNNPTGTVVANAAIVSINPSTSGSVSVYSTDKTDLIVDVTGYFTSANLAPSGLALYPSTPCRILDTRQSHGEFQGVLKVPVTSGNSCGVPVDSQAYVVNATVVPTGPLGYLTLWPDTTPQPLNSVLNANDGKITSNMAIVGSSNGSLDGLATSPAQLILDVDGYFAQAPSFNLNATPPNGLALQPGTSGLLSVTAIPVSGFAGSVQATLTGSDGLSVSPSSLTLEPGVAQTVTVQASSSAVSGSVEIQGTSGGIAKTLSVPVQTGPNFFIDSPTGGFGLGAYVTSSFVVTPTSGFHGIVGGQITGFPPGVLVGHTPTVPPYSYGSYLTADCSQPVCKADHLIIIYDGAAAGTYPLTLTATSGSITHTESLSLVVTPPTFDLSTTPTSVSISPGGSQTVNLSVSGYQAGTSGVSITVENLPSGITASPSAGIEGSTPIVLMASPTAQSGTYTVIIAGNDTINIGPGQQPPPVAPLIATTQFTLTVGPAASADESTANAKSGENTSADSRTIQP
jgi:hypothetical protein